jgi:hypothetical protein
MPQTVANLADVTKEVWTSSRLEKQFYNENPLLDRMERTSKFTIGNAASVPIHKGRAGSASILSSAGGTLNAADAQKVDKAQYTLSYQYHQVEIQLGAINQTAGTNNSAVSAVNLEVEGAVDDLRKQAMRQVVGDSTGRIAEFTTSGSGVVLNLVTPANGGRGYDAIVRGHIVPGQLVDIGSAASPTSVASARTVVSVSENSTTPTVTISGANVTTAAGDFISIAGARSGSSTFELNGLRGLISTAAAGGLNPATTGEEFWTPAQVDSTSTSLSLDLLLGYRQRVNQKTGKKANTIVTSLKQQANFESLLQNQVRFSDPSKLSAGDATLNWNGTEFMGLPDVYDTDLFMLTIEDFIIVTGGEISKPTWVSDIEGAGGRLRWTQGTTKFADALTYPFQLGVKRRNSHVAATSLTN